MEVQLLTFYNIYCTTGYPSGHELLGPAEKKQWSRVGERFFRNAAKERNGKNRISRKIIDPKKMVSYAILTGRAPKMYSSSIRPETITKHAKREKNSTLEVAEMKWH